MCTLPEELNILLGDLRCCESWYVFLARGPSACKEALLC